MNWLGALSRLSAENTGHVLVTVIETAGSTPRDTKSKMVVAPAQTYDSIGGGNLEYEAIHTARALLSEGKPATVRRTFSLGADLTQCCGGKVVLLFECFPACQFNIALFGAGHVGRALTAILSQLPCRVRWVDSRADIFPQPVAENIQTVPMKNPFEAVENCPEGAYYLIMTHSHEIDIELCEAILARLDARYCGLIGSKSKGAKFRSRLKKKGFTAGELARLTCPIGLRSVPGKTPMEVAVAVAGQLLELHHQALSEPATPALNRQAQMPSPH